MDIPRLYFDGSWHDQGSNGTFLSINPATEEVIYAGPAAGESETQAAITSTCLGLEHLRSLAPISRSRALAKAAQSLRKHKGAIATLLRLETGKIDALANAEVELAADQFEWYAAESTRIFDRMAPAREPGYRYRVMHEPIGLVAAFNSWNFPVLLLARKLAPSLASGCPMIIRPSEQGSLAAQRVVELILEAGFPPHAVALLHGDAAPISKALMASSLVRKLTFTGSTAVGEQLYRDAAATMKKLAMELGGHSPVIIDQTVDVASLITPLARLKFRNAGQVCTSPTRFFVHRSIFDEFSSAFSAATSAMKVGDPSAHASVEIGPLISQRRVAAIDRLVNDAVDKGAKLVTGGIRPPEMKRGFFYEPTILINVPNAADIMTEEPFGPVAILNQFDEIEEAVTMANNSHYGLAGYVFSRSESIKNYVIPRLECGIVAVNQFFPALAEGPLGGRKSSGFGSEGGIEGIRDFLVTKFVHEAVASASSTSI